MCFLITAVEEFLVVVQTGAIDLPVEGGEGSGGISYLMADKNTWTITHTQTHSYGLKSPSKQITFQFMWKVFLSRTPRRARQQHWCDTQIKESKCRTSSPTGRTLNCIFLINKSHYSLMLPTPRVFLSLDVSTKSQRVAPQARRRYLVILIEIYGPKWGEGGQADLLSEYKYPPTIVYR